ncbi:WG repeat-containing protein [Paenibacillus sp. SC116]|uniref:WG repeat-containing protein n=1 Tax=Paenibacillus sp. SC116 TaxID=2968986 RepID=UPI00215A1ECC|nr:WG repeat-containing protein [Paenibacillus sp. SC116]MCR8842250.1 WG repeat-containing protein [Paenibacillus sp. SC116]
MKRNSLSLALKTWLAVLLITTAMGLISVEQSRTVNAASGTTITMKAGEWKSINLYTQFTNDRPDTLTLTLAGYLPDWGYFSSDMLAIKPNPDILVLFPGETGKFDLQIKFGPRVKPGKYRLNIEVIGSNGKDGILNSDWIIETYKYDVIIEGDTKKQDIVYIDQYSDSNNQGLYAYKNSKNKYGYVNKNRKIVIPAVYDNYGHFDKNGIAVVGMKNSKGEHGYKYGLINKAGKYVLKPTYDVIGFPSEGYYQVVNNKKHGFINAQGKVAIKLQYDQVKFFAQGLAPVMKNNKWGFIDKKGKLVIQYKFQNANLFDQNNQATVILNNKYYLINKKGKIIKETEFQPMWD